MSRDFLRGGLGQAVRQVLSVAGLDRSGQRRADSLAVCPGTVSADDFHSRVAAQPVLNDIGGAALEDVDPAAGLGVDEDGRVDEAAAQREVVNPQDTRYSQAGEGNPEKDPQRGVPGDIDARRCLQPESRTSGQFADGRADLAGQPRGAPLVSVQDARDLLANVCRGQPSTGQAHPADLYLHQDAAAVGGNVGGRPLVIAVHPRVFLTAGRARCRLVPGPRPDDDGATRIFDILDDQGRQPREHSSRKLSSIDHN